MADMRNRTPFYGAVPTSKLNADHVFMPDGSTLDTTIQNITTTINNFTIYSTDETVIGEWIDGRPLYRKTVDVGELPNNTTTNTPHNISNIDDIIEATGYAKDAYGSCIALPLISGTSTYVVAVWCDSQDIKISTYYNRSMYSGYVTIVYTKSTDTPIRNRNVRRIERKTDNKVKSIGAEIDNSVEAKEQED